MRKFVNLRTPVIIALSLCVGITLGVVLYFYKLSPAWIAFSVLPAAIIFGIWAFLKRKIVKPALLVLLSLLLLIGGTLNSYYALGRFDNAELQADTEYAVHGVVTEKGATANGEYIIINKISVDGKKIDGKAYVYLSDMYGEICDIGYSVDFYGSFEIFEPFQYGKINSFAEDNIKYSSSVFSGLQSTYGYSFFGSMRSAIGKTLFNNLHSESAAVSYAMLTGNTITAKSDSMESFRYGGVAHIFAVSGLHIGIVFAIISFILKKLHVNKYASAVVSLFAIFFYTAVCGFTLSALRASIMCTVGTVANLTLERYDGLNSLAVAVIIILSFTPLSLFSVGFQLSVCAVGGIYCLSKVIERLLVKTKIPEKICAAAGASAGAQLGTMPILLSNFGYISGAGLLLNPIILPILSAVFVVLFVPTIVCAVIPIAAPYIIPYAARPLEFIISIFIKAGFEKSLISGFGAGAFVPIYFICVLCLNDKINLKFIERVIAFACSVIILTSYVLMRSYYPFSGYQVIISSYTRGGEVLIRSPQGTVLIVTDDISPSVVKDMLNRNYCQTIDAIILLGDNDISVYAELGIDCDTIYVYERDPNIQPYDGIIINYSTDFDVCGVNCSFYDQSTLLADVEGVKFGICAEENTKILNCDILVSDSANTFADCGIEVFFNNRLGALNVFDCGDIIFRIKDGNCRLTSKIPPN